MMNLGEPISMIKVLVLVWMQPSGCRSFGKFDACCRQVGVLCRQLTSIRFDLVHRTTTTLSRQSQATRDARQIAVK